MAHHSSLGMLILCCSTRGCYQLAFRGSFNNRPIHGPSVNLTVIPNPNKPVSLQVEYDTSVRFPAGSIFPGLYVFYLFVGLFLHYMHPVLSQFCVSANGGHLCLSVCAAFSMTVVSDEGSPITTFNPAAASMFLWKDTQSGQRPPETVSF